MQLWLPGLSEDRQTALLGLSIEPSEHGKKVGDGQCISLAVEALRYAGAKRYPFDPSGDYVWGRPVASFKEALPGDIIGDNLFHGMNHRFRNQKILFTTEGTDHTERGNTEKSKKMFDCLNILNCP
jgi:hypothetical protein